MSPTRGGGDHGLDAVAVEDVVVGDLHDAGDRGQKGGGGLCDVLAFPGSS